MPLEERIVLDASAAIIYVNAAAHPGGNGSSWAHAFNNLQEALTLAASEKGPEQIWIAQGTYTPSEVYSPNGVAGGASGLNVEQLETFNLPNNVSLYGGFAGHETSLSQRNPLLHPTILSGDLGNGIDVWHVVTAGNDISLSGVTATLNGLTIEDGYAAGPDLLSGTSLVYSHESGGGLYARFGSNITIDDVNFENDSAAFSPTPGISYPSDGGLAPGGGAIAAFDAGTTLTIGDSSFSHDVAGNVSTSQAQGGAIFLYGGASASISSSSFTDDQATTNGGAIDISVEGSLTLNNDIFTDNAMIGPYAPNFGSGGAVSVFNANLSVDNSTFTGNTATWTAAAIGINWNADVTSHSFVLENSLIQGNIGAFEGSLTITSLGAANSGDLATISNTVFLDNYGGGTAGAIDIDSIQTNISNSKFIGNVSGGDGGAINSDDFFNSLYGTPLTTVTVTNTEFLDNTAQGNLANIAAYNGSYSTPAFGSDFLPGGGAVNSMWNSQIIISNSTFIGNRALNGDGGAVKNGGGYMYLGPEYIATGGTITLSNDIFLGNSAKHGNGGAIANESEGFPLGTLTGVPTLTLTNSLVSLNVASGDGGGVYTDLGDNTITGNTFLLDGASSGTGVWGTESIVNGEPSSSPGAAHALALANNFIVDDIVLS